MGNGATDQFRVFRQHLPQPYGWTRGIDREELDRFDEEYLYDSDNNLVIAETPRRTHLDGR